MDLWTKYLFKQNVSALDQQHTFDYLIHINGEKTKQKLTKNIWLVFTIG